MKKTAVGLWIVFIALICHAEIRLPAIFSDGMVLQRDQKVSVWGWTDPGTEVVVEFADQKKTGKADANGKFMVRLEKMKASAKPQTLIIKVGGEVAEVWDVLVGEVWLCSGQSNMAWPLTKAMNFEKERAAADYPSIRMFFTKKNLSLEPKADCNGSWKVCTPENVEQFSATAYFFGREIHKQLDVPVGLVKSAWGGTRIQAWSSMASLEKFPSVMEDKRNLDSGAAKFDETAEEERYNKVLAEWEAKVKKARANGEKPPRKPRKRKHPHKSQHYPASLYNAMIHPLAPFAIRGAIWYQGEANAKSRSKAILYRDLLEGMITAWREAWGWEFPFYAVQLPNYSPPPEKPVEDASWAFIRESFLKFHKEVPNAGIAVGIDVGEANNIHPKNKQAIGFRLARQALAKTYKKNIVAGGPIYKSMKKDGNKIIIQFDEIGSGLVEQGGEPLKTFVIAGADKRFVAAQAAIVDNTVIVSSTEVADPVAVRYAWADNPEDCNLFNKEGFPASPFRTDDWPPVGE